MIDLCTGATWKRQVYLILLIRSSIRRVPYDLIEESFAAMSDKLGGLFRSGLLGGTRVITSYNKTEDPSVPAAGIG